MACYNQFDMRISTVYRILFALVALTAIMLMVSCGGPRQTRSKTNVTNALDKQYRQWKGAPYRMGGLSKRGVDCSGFVQLTFRDRLHKKLPRTTKAQARYGKKISKGSLKPGDLVFFKTSPRVRHVGIYMGRNRFLHASTSSGVMISKLDNVYWKKKYWQARRVL